MNLWADIDHLPTSGTAWNALKAGAGKLAVPNLKNQDDDADVYCLAASMVAARTADKALRDQTIHAIISAIGSEAGGRALAEGRNAVGVILSADFLELKDARFWSWVEGLLHEKMTGGPASLVATHEERPNNWGTHAGASRVAIDWALAKYGTAAQKQRAIVDGHKAVAVWMGWFGDRASYSGFSYTSPFDWHADQTKKVGINPKGATRSGHSIDGVLPDDQRRAGGFAWPPPKENYVYEALQGATAAAQLLARAPIPGPKVWSWSDNALLRAFTWLHAQASYPAGGDDQWQPWIINQAYGTKFPAHSPAGHGKNVGWTDWTHA